MCGMKKSESSGKMGLRWWVGVVMQWAELIFASLIHTVCGFFMVSSILASDLSKSLTELFKPSPDVEIKELDESNSPSHDHDEPPVVLVHGMFGFGEGKMGRMSYFGGAEHIGDRVLVPDLGALSSIHDRARQLFYYLKGGRVDYGEEHSKAAGHSRFGKLYEHGHYPEWDENHPVHFVAHSAGGQVVRVLQQMLADKAFKGHDDTSENWVLSITNIAGAINGSTRTYIDGMMPQDWRCVKSISLFEIIRISMILYEWMDIGWMKAYFDFGFEHFGMSWRKVGFSGLIDCLMGNAGPVASGDWVLADLTLQGSILINSHVNTFPNTYYFSYACKQTKRVMGFTVPCQILDMHPSFWLRSMQMSQWRYPSELEPPYKGYRDEDWEDNDGALNTISMTHPRFPIEHPNRLISSDDECQMMEPGIWYYKILEADHMLFVFNRERAGARFDLMYHGIFDRCRKHVFRRRAQTVCCPLPIHNTELNQTKLL